VLKEQPDSVQARYLLGLSYSFVERHAEAETALAPLWPQFSDQFVYLYVLGNSAFYAKDEATDQKALTRLIEVGGDTPQFHLLMGKALLTRSDDQKALDELEKAEKGDAKLPFLHFNFGFAYLHLGTRNARRRNFERILRRRRFAVQPRATRETLFEFGAGCGGGEGIPSGVGDRTAIAGDAAGVGAIVASRWERGGGVEGFGCRGKICAEESQGAVVARAGLVEVGEDGGRASGVGGVEAVV